MGFASVTPATFHHEALFYAGDDEFAERCRSFVEDGLERGEPVLVMVGSKKLELLRTALGERAERVGFADMEVVGRNPARIIPAWSRFVAENAPDGGSGGMRGIGEPIWAGRGPDELSECQLHRVADQRRVRIRQRVSPDLPVRHGRAARRCARGGAPEPSACVRGGRPGAVR